MGAEQRGSVMDASIPDMAKEDILDLVTRIPSVKLQPPANPSATRLEHDDRLRAFDEL
jgi:hypothetical protein